MKKLNLLLGAVLAGIAIGIGGTVYLSLDNKIVGSLLFSVGLYMVCLNGLNLFTGKVGYAVEQPLSYILDLIVIWIGNFLGTGFVALTINLTRVSGIKETAAKLSETKLNDSPISLFILGIFCGILMFVAVDGYKNSSNPIILFTCVSVFILCGFEHCIADMFYFSLSGIWSATAFIYIIIITLGNSLGGILIPLWKKQRV